jgi:outer membrane receptor protein involved in Fe transport
MRLLVVMLIALLLAVSSRAQTPGTATLRGRVTDPQGALVAGARIEARQSATGFERHAQTDSQGAFVLTDLSPGVYVLRVQAGGFADRQYPPITLRVGRVAEVSLRLEALGRQERVEVAGESLSVRTVSSVVEGVLTSNAIEQLPLNGRNFLELSFLVPGNAPAPTFDPTKANTVLVSSAGQFGRGGNVTIDGADNNDDVVGGPLQNLPQDAIQEFQIATSGFSAEIGRSASSAVNIVTKSGGDRWSGSASVFLRDGRWQGLPATYDRSQGEAPPFDRQQYALSAGGPLVPGRLVWFGALEYRNQEGGAIVGQRDTASRTILRVFAPTLLDDLLGTTRLDWTPTVADRMTLRYSHENATDTSQSALERPLGSASQRQDGDNRFDSILGTWTRVVGSRGVNVLSASYSRFRNAITPVATGPQLTFPSLQDGSSFRVPQSTDQDRYQASDTFSLSAGPHALRAGAEVQAVRAAFGLGVFRQGRVEMVEDFPSLDRNGDGRIDDNDLLFAVTLRSGFPDRDLDIPNCDNDHLAFFVQDDWRVRPQLTLNVGLRYELDTNVKNISGVPDLNPLILPFLHGTRGRDTNNWGPRIGFNWTTKDARLSVRGGYGIYYDRVVLELASLERGLDGRSLPIEVRAGNAFFADPTTGRFPPAAPSLANPFTGFILPGAGASGINIIDNSLQNPSVQQFHLGVEMRPGRDWTLRLDGLHDLGTHFIIGRPVGTVFNPVVGGPDRVVNLESSVNTHYDALLVAVEKTMAGRHWLRASYTLSKALNYANDDQIPFATPPVDPNDLRKEYGPAPNDQRHRLTLAGSFSLPWELRLSPIWTLATAVPMDILLPSGDQRIPGIQRNAGGRQFHTAAELNAYIQKLNAAGGVDGVPLPLVSDDAGFGDAFDSLDLRLSRPFRLGRRVVAEALVEVFNVFNTTNFLGVSNRNYSGYSNALVRDSNDPSSPGFLRSSSFGHPVSTAGGAFGSGGPRAFQLGARVTF